jgi:uncharacterized protein YdcH (DUF465 family)
MEITIKEEGQNLVISDTDLDNANFVTLYIENTEVDDVIAEIVVDIESLAGAVNAFVEKRRLALEREKQYEK